MAFQWQMRIPEIHYGGFRRLADLTPQQFKSLRQAIKEATPTLLVSGIARQVAAAPGVREEDASEIVPMIVSLHVLRDELQIPIQRFVETIVDALAHAPDAARGTRGNGDAIRKRLTDLLEDGSPLTAVAKAQTLATENERTYLDARIISDVRPLFSEDPTLEPASAILIHTLKIAFIKGDDRQEFFVSLGTNDLRSLQRLVDRAEQKAVSLESRLSSTVTILTEVEKE